MYEFNRTCIINCTVPQIIRASSWQEHLKETDYLETKANERGGGDVTQHYRTLKIVYDWPNILILDFVHRPNFTEHVSEAGSASSFRQRSTEPGKPLWSSHFQSLGNTQTLNLLRYAPENRSSPRVVTATELKKKTTRLKNNAWSTPPIKTIKRAAKSVWSGHEQDTKKQNRRI
jgi:hypothetical protein